MCNTQFIPWFKFIQTHMSCSCKPFVMNMVIQHVYVCHFVMSVSLTPLNLPPPPPGLSHCSADRQLSAIFMVLPTRKELPDYYQIIKKPIDLKKMRVSTCMQCVWNSGDLITLQCTAVAMHCSGDNYCNSLLQS